MPSAKFRDGMAQARIGAWRHYGRKYAFWFVFGPIIGKTLGIVAALAAVYIVGWVLIPHVVLGWAALAVAGGLAQLAVVRWFRKSSTRARITARAQGRSVRAPGLGWAYVLLIGACSGMAWLALWSPFA